MWPGRSRVWAALLTVYVVWGSTYLAIEYALRSLPPFLMASSRFLVAGAILLAIGWVLARRAGDAPPARRNWGAVVVLGVVLFAVGNGAVGWAQQRLTSGVTSLVVCTVPLWMALFDRIAYGRRLSALTVTGVVVGFAGAALLAAPGGADDVDAVGVGVLVAGAAAWAAGSLWSRRASLPRQPLLGTGLQMLVGAAALAVVAAATGESGRVHGVTAVSIGGVAYLVVVGSLVGFTLYAWLLRNAATPLVSTYAFANPVVAVLLGWGVEHERLGLRTLGAAVLIVAAVGLIVLAQAREPEAAATLGS